MVCLSLSPLAGCLPQLLWDLDRSVGLCSDACQVRGGLLGLLCLEAMPSPHPHCDPSSQRLSHIQNWPPKKFLLSSPTRQIPAQAGSSQIRLPAPTYSTLLKTPLSSCASPTPPPLPSPPRHQPPVTSWGSTSLIRATPRLSPCAGISHGRITPFWGFGGPRLPLLMLCL